jgi:hypothetical protein
MPSAAGITAAGSFLGGVGNVAGALRKPDKQEVVRPDPFKGALSTGSYWMGGGQLRTTTGDVIAQERDLRGRLGALAQTVKPGFSQARQALSSMFGAGRQQAVGTLRANLSQRGLLGASFANDQIAQLESEFKLKEALAISETYQMEFDKTLATLQAEGMLKEQQAARELAELGIATDFLRDVNQITSKQSTALAELAGDQALRAAGMDPDSLDLPPPPPTAAPLNDWRAVFGRGGRGGGSQAREGGGMRDRTAGRGAPGRGGFGRDSSNFGH